MCLIIDVSAIRFGLGFTYDALKFSCHMFMHFSCIRSFLIYSEHVFPSVLSLSLSLSLSRIDCFMAPKKHKSTPAQNPFHGFRSSSSLPPVSSHVQFHDENAKKDFFENFLD